MSDRLKTDIAKYLEEIAARASIAEVCLAYSLELDEDLPAKAIRQDFPLAQYSAQYWAGYAQAAESCSETVRTLAIEFFSCKSSYTTCYRLCNPDRPWEVEPNEYRVLEPPLYYASHAGLASPVRVLLDKGADVNAQDGYYGNALQAASSKGHEEVVQMLLDKGADVNAQGGYYGNALYAALSGGHEVVQILLQNKSNVSAVDKDR